MGALLEAINALQAEAATYSQGVQVWMRIMAASYFAGIVFVPWRREALWIVLMAAFTFVLLVMGKMLEPTLTRLFLGSAVLESAWTAKALSEAGDMGGESAGVKPRELKACQLWQYIFISSSSAIVIGLPYLCCNIFFSIPYPRSTSR
jgi:hypothetical protein